MRPPTSHPSASEPRLCPSMVNRGYREASTSRRERRKTNETLSAGICTPKCPAARASICAPVAWVAPCQSGSRQRAGGVRTSVSPVYTTAWHCACSRSSPLIATQSTRSPPPPALQ